MLRRGNGDMSAVSGILGTSRAVRVHILATAAQEAVYRRIDRLFAWLLLFEWAAAAVRAVGGTPLTGVGSERTTHPHVVAALVLGAAITSFPVFLAFTQPGRPLTRHVIAAAQMLMSALLIHLTGGRIETH